MQNLIDRGYTPIITWEMMHNGYARLDPVQPNFDELLSGKFDGYIDAFANQIKTYSGTVILRIFHEFEGDWYCWGLTHNGKDPQKYIAAFRHVVNRFRAAGANNVKWMWCLNAEPKPYVRYNWVVSCYPGDEYVDIVATDIYNHPDLGTPDWKSFRYTAAESYYYLVKYFSHKPLYICEVGCRERYPGEPANSLSKGEWLCQMDADLQSYFKRVSALVFFNLHKEHDWRIQSSEGSKQAFVDCIWSDSYYGGTVTVTEHESATAFKVWPNPFDHEVRLLSTTSAEQSGEPAELSVYDLHGKLLVRFTGGKIPVSMDLGYLPAGVYIFEYRSGETVKRHKLIHL